MSKIASLNRKLEIPPPPTEPVATGEDQKTPFLPDRTGKTSQRAPVSPVVTGEKTALTALTSGPAPDPANEIAVHAEPGIEATPEGETRFRHIAFETASNDNPIKYVDGNGETGEVTISVTSEEDFIEFWSEDAWSALSGIARMFRLDLSAIETEEDEKGQGRKAAAHLWKLANRYPKWLGWMKSGVTMSGGDAIFCLAFFGGKASAVYGAWRDRETPSEHQINDGVVGGENVDVA